MITISMAVGSRARTRAAKLGCHKVSSLRSRPTAPRLEGIIPGRARSAASTRVMDGAAPGRAGQALGSLPAFMPCIERTASCVRERMWPYRPSGAIAVSGMMNQVIRSLIEMRPFTASPSWTSRCR